jgi:hypothetical protein
LQLKLIKMEQKPGVFAALHNFYTGWIVIANSIPFTHSIELSLP